MIGFSILNYIPAKLRTKPLFQKVAQVVDYLSNNDYVNSEKISKRYYDIINKHKDYRSLQLETIYDILEETGYGYIVDTFSLDEESLRTFMSFLSLIHLFKGSKRGVEIVFKLMSIENYKIEEWWETSPFKEECTFSLEIELIPTLFTADVKDKINNFIRNYVYPLLTDIILYVNIDIDAVRVGVGYGYSAEIELEGSSPDLIWDDDINGIWESREWSVSGGFPGYYDISNYDTSYYF
jgi:hypothetical protein